MNKLTTLLLFVILFVITDAYGQSEFFKPGSSGIAASFSTYGNKESSGTGGVVSGSIYGKIDIGLQFGNSTTDGPYQNSEINNPSTLFYLGYNIRKESAKGFVKFLIGYYKTTAEFNYANDIKSSGVVLGVGIFYNIYKNDILLLQPNFGLTYGFLSSTSQGYSNNDNELINLRTISLGFNLGVRTSQYFILFIGPSASKDIINSDNSIVWGLEIGAAIGS